MNPPYGSKTQHTSPHLHLQFVESTLNITNKLVAVFPNRIAFSSSKEYDNFKKVFDDRLEEIEEIDSNVFTGTVMPNVGIFKFSEKIFLNENFSCRSLKIKNAPLISRQEVQWKKYLKSIKYIINI